MPAHIRQRAWDRGIIGFGDSIMENVAGSVQLGQRCYPMASARLGRNITNRNVGGTTSTQALAALNAYPVGTQILSIETGRNDPGASISAATTKSNISAMVAKATDNRFVVHTILWYANGTEPAGGAARNAIISLNDWMKATWPANVLDVSDALDNNSYRADGLHLNAAGSAIYSDLFVAFMAQHADW